MIEIAVWVKGKRLRLPALQPGDPPASFTDAAPERTTILLVGCHADDDGGTIYRSRQGWSMEAGTSRLVHSAGLVVEHALGRGERWACPLHHPKLGRVRLEVCHRQT